MSVTPFSSTQLLTCRYWAFGPECPDSENCAFVHWDTGRLSSHLQQRGTCFYWRSRRCRHGARCFYEHRKTGVPALYQGLVELHGFDLEIADAAAKSGFNTFNHVALFDLIWSVKRLALKSPAHDAFPLTQPGHTLYPDRYRPSRVGDGTARKRSRLDGVDPNPSYPLSNLKGKNKNVSKAMQPKHTPILSKGPKTQMHVITTKQQNLTPIWTSKRLKIDRMGTYKAEQNPVHRPQPTKIKATTEIVDELHRVKKELEKSQDAMVVCQVAMKDLFDRNSAILGAGMIMPDLKALSESMFKVHDEAKAGQIAVKQTILSLGDLEGTTV